MKDMWIALGRAEINCTSYQFDSTFPYLAICEVFFVCLLICFVHFCLQERKMHPMVPDGFVILCAFNSIYINHTRLDLQFVKNFIEEGSINWTWTFLYESKSIKDDSN